MTCAAQTSRKNATHQLAKQQQQQQNPQALIKSWRKHTDLHPDNDDCNPAPSFIFRTLKSLTQQRTFSLPFRPPSLLPWLSTAKKFSVLQDSRQLPHAKILHTFCTLSHTIGAKTRSFLSRPSLSFLSPSICLWPRRCLQRNLRHARNETRCQEKRFPRTKSSKDFEATIIAKNLLVELFRLLASESK
jgi:hypothetical protein